jgi:hypothetical protein
LVVYGRRLDAALVAQVSFGKGLEILKSSQVVVYLRVPIAARRVLSRERPPRG